MLLPPALGAALTWAEGQRRANTAGLFLRALAEALSGPEPQCMGVETHAHVHARVWPLTACTRAWHMGST